MCQQEVCRKLLKAAKSLLDNARDSTPILAEHGAQSLAFRARADQMAAAWRELSEAVKEAEKEGN